jgi:hypothetical protein
MGLLDTVWSAIGPGASGAALAAATYAGAAAVEKEARLVARQDIAKFLRGFGGDFNISLVAHHISDFFDIIFGERHFSAKCILRSIGLTLMFFCLTLLVTVIKTPGFVNNVISIVNEQLPTSAKQLPAKQFPANQLPDLADPEFRNFEFYAIFVALFVSIITISVPVDYISLWKSRIILSYISSSGDRLYKVLFLTFGDFVLSIIVFSIYWTVLIGMIFVGNTFAMACADTASMIYSLPKGYSMLLGSSGDVRNLLNVICVTSTILTSIWTLAVLFSAIFLRIAISLRYPLAVLTWLFDVDEHPIKIIGIMLAAFLWSGSVLYGLL